MEDYIDDYGTPTADLHDFDMRPEDQYDYAAPTPDPRAEEANAAADHCDYGARGTRPRGGDATQLAEQAAAASPDARAAAARDGASPSPGTRDGAARDGASPSPGTRDGAARGAVGRDGAAPSLSPSPDTRYAPSPGARDVVSPSPRTLGPITAANIVRSTATDRVPPSKARALDLVLIRRSFYMCVDLIHPDARSWSVRRDVTIARALATMLARESRFPPLDRDGQPDPSKQPDPLTVPAVTMEAALVMRGLGAWLSTPDVAFWPGSLSTVTRTLPALVVHKVHVDAAKALPLTGTRLGEPVEMIRGVPVVSVDEMIVDLLRYAHPLLAWAGVTSALRSMVTYHRTAPDSMRVEDEKNRQRIDAKLSLVADSDGVGRGREILRLADTKAESLAEAVLLWLLHVIVWVPPQGTVPFEAQSPVMTRDGLFHVDVGFPEVRLGVEFDGVGKFLHDPDVVKRFLDRQHSILAAGWDLIALSWSDLRNPEAFVEPLAQKLLEKGIRTRAPGGILWADFPREMLNPSRVT